MRFRNRRRLVRLLRSPLWFRYLVFPFALACVGVPRSRLAASAVVAAVLSALKYREALPIYDWRGIILASTSFLWFPVLAGYIVVVVMALDGLLVWLRAQRRKSDA